MTAQNKSPFALPLSIGHRLDYNKELHDSDQTYIGLITSDDVDQGQDRATFIVRCVNSNAGLINALKEIANDAPTVNPADLRGVGNEDDAYYSGAAMESYRVGEIARKALRDAGVEG